MNGISSFLHRAIFVWIKQKDDQNMFESKEHLIGYTRILFDPNKQMFSLSQSLILRIGTNNEFVRMKWNLFVSNLSLITYILKLSKHVALHLTVHSTQYNFQKSVVLYLATLSKIFLAIFVNFYWLYTLPTQHYV